MMKHPIQQYGRKRHASILDKPKRPSIVNFSEKLKAIERLHYLIRRKGTGSPRELANRLNISERCLYHLLSEMKSMGAPIYYNKSRNSYCYEYEIEFVSELFQKP